MYAGPARRVAIIGGSRIPFARSHTAYAKFGNRKLLTATIKGLVEKYNLRGETLGDVCAGAVIKHSSDFNLARESVLGSGLAPDTPAFDLQRACGTALEAAILIGLKIASGQIDSGIAGGTDTISDVPIVYPRSYRQILMASNRGRSAMERIKPLLGIRPKHFKPSLPGVEEPRTGLSMGESCEIMAKQWNISRQDQDQLAMESHLKMAAAYEEGFYDDLVTEFAGLTRDNNMRADTSMEKLAKLKPAFDRKSGQGTLTAGNSTPLTDGVVGGGGTAGVRQVTFGGQVGVSDESGDRRVEQVFGGQVFRPYQRPALLQHRLEVGEVTDDGRTRRTDLVEDAAGLLAYPVVELVGDAEAGVLLLDGRQHHV